MPLSSQLFDDSRIQGVRLTFTDGAVSTFYGPLQIDPETMKANGATLSDLEIFEPRPLPDGMAWEPIAATAREEQP
jgi:hypothetical protein